MKRDSIFRASSLKSSGKNISEGFFFSFQENINSDITASVYLVQFLDILRVHSGFIINFVECTG